MRAAVLKIMKDYAGTQAQMAKEAGIGQATLHRYKNYEFTRINTQTIAKLEEWVAKYDRNNIQKIFTE